MDDRHPDGGHGQLFMLELVLGLTPDAVFDPKALLGAAICPEISEKV
jgi:hypothetical protein